MKRLFILFAFCVITVSTYSCKSSAAENGNAKIVLDCGPEYNWGEVWLGTETVLSAKIKVYNPGTDTLRIAEVKNSCGCTTAPINKDRIAPGDSAELDVKLRPGSMPAPIDKTITIHSNATENSTYVVHLRANLRTTLATESKFLAFNLVQVGKETEAVVSIQNSGTDDVTITDFKADPPDMKLSIKRGEVIGKGKSLKIRLSFVPKQAKMYTPMLTIKTSDPQFPELKYMGRCEVVDYDPYSPSK